MIITLFCKVPRQAAVNKLKYMNNIEQSQSKTQSTVPWKLFVVTSIESLLAFYLATFCMAMYFIHRGTNWVIPGVFLGLFYLFVIFVCAKRVIEKLSLATVMLIIPIAPLLAIIIVISLIPILQLLR